MSADVSAAVAWFQANPDERIPWIGSPPMGLFGNAQRHAVTIVRGLIAEDVVVLTRADWNEIKLIGERWPTVRAELERLQALQPPADLPATLASVDDVATVARAAGFAQANEDEDYWKDDHDVLLDVTSEYGDDDRGLDEVCVQRSDDTDVATVHGGAPGALLWHAIQAARSAS